MYRVVLIVLFVCLLLRNGPMKASSCGVGESSDLVAEAAAATQTSQLGGGHFIGVEGHQGRGDGRCLLDTRAGL